MTCLPKLRRPTTAKIRNSILRHCATCAIPVPLLNRCIGTRVRCSNWCAIPQKVQSIFRATGFEHSHAPHYLERMRSHGIIAVAQATYNLILLIKSIQVLPINFTPQAVRMLAYTMLRLDLEGPDERVIYCGVGLLWLALHLEISPPDENLIELSAWIVRREAEIHKTRSWAFDRWLLGIGHDPPPSPWESLGQDLSELELSHHQRELQDWVKLIGAELSGEGSERSGS